MLYRWGVLVDLSGDKSGKPLDYLRQIIKSEQLDLGVSIPAIVDSFDPATQMIEATPVIRRRRRLEDGSFEVEDRQKQIKIPLCTPYVRMLGFSLTMPISAGDQVLFCFADRGIDLWQETGEISDPPDTNQVRAHNYTDAIYIVGPIDLASPIEDYRIDCAELRNRLRDTAVTIWENEAQVRAFPTNRTTWTSTGDVDTFAPSDINELALGDITENAGGNIEEEAIGDITSLSVGGSIERDALLGHATASGLDITENAGTSIEMDAGTFIDAKAGTTINVEGGGTVTIKSAGLVVIEAPAISIIGNATITGNLIVTGTVTAAGFSGPASAAANFTNGLTTPNAVINGIESKNHKHNETGTQTGIPIAGP
jgi:phage baseplate assembly protein gpV